MKNRTVLFAVLSLFLCGVASAYSERDREFDRRMAAMQKLAFEKKVSEQMQGCAEADMSDGVCLDKSSSEVGLPGGGTGFAPNAGGDGGGSLDGGTTG